jgi:hypothetical protein
VPFKVRVGPLPLRNASERIGCCKGCWGLNFCAAILQRGGDIRMFMPAPLKVDEATKSNVSRFGELVSGCSISLCGPYHR